MRLFIAIQLSEDMKRALTACMNDLKKQGVTGNYVPAQNLHLTLAFIGEYDKPERIKDAINSIPLPRLRLKLSEKGKFGDLLWAGIQENQDLHAYVKNLRAALKEVGIPYAHDKFIPHITLIRRFVSKKPYQVHLRKTEMYVDKISLMKSERKNGKMVYQEI